MNKKTQNLLLSAIMGAIAYILMYASFPVIPALPFLKIDFSDIPIILVAFVQGPLGAFFSAFIARLLHYLFTGGEMGIPLGDMTSLIASMAYILPIYYLLRGQVTKYILHKENAFTTKDKMKKIWAYSLGILCLTFVMSILNYYIITPFYIHIMQFPIDNMCTYILYGIVPFNLIKGVVVSLVGHVVVIKVLPHLISKFGFKAYSQKHVHVS